MEPFMWVPMLEYLPAARPVQIGLRLDVTGPEWFLPNVPVTALKIFHAGATKLLRASTYGRGLWQFPLTTAANFRWRFLIPFKLYFFLKLLFSHGALTSLNGYNSGVSLSCTAGFHRSSNDLHDLLFSLNTQWSIHGHSKRSAWRLFFQAACGGSSTEQHHFTTWPITLHIVDFALALLLRPASLLFKAQLPRNLLVLELPWARLQAQ